ncbi:uncharacterized protein BN553_01567 [Firmicutes bacterium CAG:238]|nr:uncharacterized protein BN553_01567 [Firmicutes bacterium CAG:238]
MEFNYLVEKKRMHNSLGRTDGQCVGVECTACPLSRDNNDFDSICGDFEIEHPIEATEIVRKWAEEHPRKTMKDILLEKFPNAKLDSSTQRPLACAFALGLCPKCTPFDDCEDCWNTEAKE